MSTPLDITHANNIGNMVETSSKTKPIKGLKQGKKTAAKSPKAPAAPKERKGRTPSAADVRGAMASGNITPEEAGHLNPKAGFKPEWNDVRDAFNGGHITVEEASDLLGKKPRAPKETKRGAQWVNSEQERPAQSSQPASRQTSRPAAIEAPRKELGATQKAESPNKGKQFRGSTARLAGNRLSWDEMQTGKYAGAIMSGPEINKRSGIKVGQRPSTRAQKDPEYRQQLLTQLDKEAAKHGE